MGEHQEWYGMVDIDKGEPIVGGSYITRVLTYEVGKYGMDNGGRIRMLFRYVTDAGVPQLTDPKADNYITAYASNSKVDIKGRYIPKGGYRPWMHALEFEVKSESLDEGEKIYIVIGDRKSGSKGYKAQTFIETNFMWKVEVECFETGVWVPLNSSPIVPIISGLPARALLLAPSFGEVGQKMAATLKIEDEYGNSSPYEGIINVFVEEIDAYGNAIKMHTDIVAEEIDGVELGYTKIDMTNFCYDGYYRVVADVEGLSESRIYSNPIIIGALPNGKKHYWGDFHAQYSNSTGVGSVAEAFTYARDAAGISFVGHQPNDFLLTEEGWQEAKDAVKEFHEPHAFIPILGYEWSGVTPKGGDRNIHYLNDDGPLHRTSHWQVTDKTDIESDRYDLDELYKTLENREDVIIVPHVGGRRCNIAKYFNEKLETVVEICSCHGRFEWLLEEALDNGYVIGVVGGSDDHTGRPGLAYSTNEHFGTRGGLTGVFVDELERKSIFEAVKSRDTYATSGERIALLVSTKDGNFMGDQWHSEHAPSIQVQAAGAQPLEKVEVYRNKELVHSERLYKTQPVLTKIRLEWGGARVKGRGRQTNWNGTLVVENGTIISAECFAFDHPKQGITSETPTKIEWKSTTSGDHDGIIVTIDGDAGTLIEFSTPHGCEKISLGELMNNPIKKQCGGVDQYYQITTHFNEVGPQIINFEWQDEALGKGRNAYWVKVVQVDGETAWSSPMYVMNEKASK